MKFENLKYLNFIFWRTKRAFEVKWKAFCLVWQVLSFRLKGERRTPPISGQFFLYQRCPLIGENAVYKRYVNQEIGEERLAKFWFKVGDLAASSKVVAVFTRGVGWYFREFSYISFCQFARKIQLVPSSVCNKWMRIEVSWYQI